MRPGVYIQKGNGQLGGLLPKEDGVTILVVASAKYTTDSGDSYFVPQVGFQLADFEDLGITEQSDRNAGELVWEHIKDFYGEATNGGELHVMFFPLDVTYATFLAAGLTNIHVVRLQNYLKAQAGRIKIVVFAHNPSFVEAAWAISPDLFQSLADAEFSKTRPIDILVEGRKMPAVSGITLDLRTYDAENVGIFWAREKNRKTALAATTDFAANITDNYAAIGALAGRLASIDVASNPGDATIGKLKNWTNAELSNGTAISDLSDAAQDNLDTKGFIFATSRPGVAGLFFNDSHTCVSILTDYTYLERNRVINKAVRLANIAYQAFVLGKVYIDPATGKLSGDTVNTMAGAMRTLINDNMAGEIITEGTLVTIDPNQNVNTGNLTTLVEVLGIGINRALKVKVQFRNPTRIAA